MENLHGMLLVRNEPVRCIGRPMRLVCALAIFAFSAFSHAAAWKNDTYGCQATLPDSAGWQSIDVPGTPTMSVLIAMQHPVKGSVFGINVVHDLPSTNLKDPATVAAIEKTLQTLGYQFFGKSTVPIGGREWLQYPVRSAVQSTTGVMRYTAANNQIYVVSLLRTGGLEAAQDSELQSVAASVRVADVKSVAAAPTSPAPAPAPAPAAVGTTPAPAKPANTEAEPETESVKIGPVTLTKEQFKLGLYGVVGLFVLMILLKIVGGGNKQK